MIKPILKIFFIGYAIIASIAFCNIVYATPAPILLKTDGDVEVYTYKSECDCSSPVFEYTCSKGQDQTIIRNKTVSPDTAYIFQHGDGFRNNGDYCSNRLKVCKDLNDKAKNILFVGFKMAGGAGEGTSWSGNYNAQCLHKEAKTVAESIIGAGKFPNKIIIASFSQGGIAVKNMFIKNKQPSGIIYTLFLDSCYSSHCETVAQKSTSIRGIMKMYRSTIQTDSKDLEIKNAQQNEAATAFMNSNPPPSTSLTAVNSKHGDVPENCSFDFLLNNSCNGKALSGGITGTGSTQGVDVPFINEIIQLTKPTPRITIPGLNFSDIKEVDEDGGKFLYIPFIGEYIAAIYKYGVAIASIIAVVMIINAGFGWAISGGEPEKINHAKTRIGQCIVGLFLAVASYTLLYMINPNLVEFKSLRVSMIPRDTLTDVPESSAHLLPGGVLPATDGTVAKPAQNLNEINETLFETTDINSQKTNGWEKWQGMSEGQKNVVLPFLFLPIGECNNIIPSIHNTGINYSNFKNLKLNQAIFPALQKAADLATKYGFKLYISSDFRFIKEQTTLWNTGVVARYLSGSKKWQTNEGIIAKPGCTAPHATGGAVDVYLQDSTGNKNLAGPGGSVKTTLENQANYSAKYLSQDPPYNLILEEIMRQAGFARYCKESWHFENMVTERYNKWDKQSDTRCVATYDNWHMAIPTATKNNANKITKVPIL